MKILVMGGTQFVSSYVAKHLISKGYEVDIFTRGLRGIDYEGYADHLKGDRRSNEDLKSQLNGKQYNYVYDISAYTKEDVEILLSVLDKTKLKNFILCSSASVYKETNDIINEDYPRGQNNHWGDYGLNKKLAEDYLFEINKTQNFPFTIFRPTYIYGEGNNLYRESYLFDRIENSLLTPIPKSKNIAQFIHIEDLAKTFESVIDNDRAIGNAYNLTNPDEITWKLLCKNASEALDKPLEVKEVNCDELALESKSFFPFRDVTTRLNTSKLENDCLHIPEISLVEGLKLAYKWYYEEKPEFGLGRMTEIERVLNS